MNNNFSILVAVVMSACLCGLPTFAIAGECGGFTVVSQLNLEYKTSVFVLDGLGQTITIAQGPGVTYYDHWCLCKDGGTGYGSCNYLRTETSDPTSFIHADDGCVFDGGEGYQYCRCTNPSSVCCD